MRCYFCETIFQYRSAVAASTVGNFAGMLFTRSFGYGVLLLPFAELFC